MFLIIIFFSLWCPVGGEPVGLLFLHLSWVPGPEGGIPRNVGGDHQWPDTKGGVRPHSHDLLPQEVTLYTDGTEAALRTRKRGARKVQGREEMCWEGPSCWPAPCRSVCQRPRTGWKDLEKRKRKKEKVWGRRFWPCSHHERFRAADSLRSRAWHTEKDLWQMWQSIPKYTNVPLPQRR